MKPNPLFQQQPKSFWALIRSLSEKLGYSKKGELLVPNVKDIVQAYVALGLNPTHLLIDGRPTHLCQTVIDYFTYRAHVLTSEVEPRLMDASRAKDVFQKLKVRHNPTCPLPMNKQKGDKKSEAYLTGIINMIIESQSAGHSCDYDPRHLTSITRDGSPVRTLARRVDGAFPGVINPIAIRK
jgi:hypothetical protein